ncbi:putative 6-phosphogluconolactonase 4, chloroplastic [Vitis vinifera]|uniref:Putative 6-phosphogluconolactonase 4, chloroplastic n=1 Tax=Vitis vinifera TaxID=29760 RepID=A0A438BUI6_VITVI|nr:putative 6-phosphogluconolactonase 4, chloroplastic [Vitis vinifera]
MDCSRSLLSFASVRRSQPSIPLISPLVAQKPRSCTLALRSKGVPLICSNPKKFRARTRSSMAEVTADNGKGKVKVFDSEEEVAVGLAKYTADISNKITNEKSSFTVVLSGGSLIHSLRKLVEAPYIDSIEWGKWHVFWVDERVVPKDHVDSNYKLAYDGFLSKGSRMVKLGLGHFLVRSIWRHSSPQCSLAVVTSGNEPKFASSSLHDAGDTPFSGWKVGTGLVVMGFGIFVIVHFVPIPPGQVYAINDALSAEGAADDYETCLKHLVTTGVLQVSAKTGFPKFDLMLLGMGPDGHVASLFPGHPLVKENKKWVTFIKDSPKPPPERITFTFPVINSSAYIAMVVVGAGKASAIEATLGKSPNSEVLPVGMVSPEDEMTWFFDKQAASKI